MPDFVRIQLHDDGEGIEAVWARAVDAGLYEIASVPFLHMSPTAGDVVAVTSDAAGELTVDKVVKHSGRWTAVYNWYPHEGGTSADVLSALERVAKKDNLVVEKAMEPQLGVVGCVYVAAPARMTPEQLDSLVGNAGAPADLERVLPVAGSPAKPARISAKPASKPSTKKATRSAKKSKPAKKKASTKKATRSAKKAKPAKKKASAKKATRSAKKSKAVSKKKKAKR